MYVNLLQEDEQLRRLVASHGPQKWSVVAEKIKGRSGKSCRLRCGLRDALIESFVAREPCVHEASTPPRPRGRLRRSPIALLLPDPAGGGTTSIPL